MSLSESPPLTPRLDEYPKDGITSSQKRAADRMEPAIGSYSRFTSPKFLAGSIIVFLIGLRLIVAANLVLLPEEAYYWMYSKYPAWGYLDHPPMVAWLIAFGTSLFGETELGVRIGTCALSVASTWLCYVLASHWYDRRAGLSAAVFFSITPMFFGTGFLAMPDAPLIFFWLVMMIAVTKAYRNDSFGWWLIAGIAAGLGFVSKYTAVFMVMSTFLFLLSDRRGRRMLCGPAPWMGMLLAVVIASPVIYWNATNEWASFRFQFARRLGQQNHIALLNTPIWLTGQFFLMTPLLFISLATTLCVTIRRFRRDTVGRYRFAACFAAPWLAMCVWHGISTNVKINWPLPAYLSLIPTAVVLLRVRNLPILRHKGWPERQRVVRRYAVVVTAVLVGVSVVSIARFPFIPLPGAIIPWDEVGTSMELVEDAHEQTTGQEPFIITDGKYRLASELGFYMRKVKSAGSQSWQDVVPMAVGRGNGLAYGYWRDLGDFVGRDALYVTDAPVPAVTAVLADLFDSVGQPKQFFSYATALVPQWSYWAIPCHSFRGMPAE